MKTLVQTFARQIWNIGAFKDLNRSPEGRGFRLKLHEKNPDAPLSPFYVDLRLIQSDLSTKSTAVDLFEAMLGELYAEPDLLGAIPEAIVPIVSTLSDHTSIPMITPRQPKGHGSGAKIDGIYDYAQRVVLFDDVITSADSKLEAAQTVRSAGLTVVDVMVLVDRVQGGRELLSNAGLALHAATTIIELLDFYHDEGMMSEDVYQRILEYRAAVVK